MAGVSARNRPLTALVAGVIRRVPAIVYSFGFVAVPALIGGAVYFTSWASSQSVAAVPFASGALPLIMWLLAIALATLALTFTIS